MNKWYIDTTLLLHIPDSVLVSPLYQWPSLL